MSTALYRRYRPDTFEEVIGQDHVTAPLMNALRKNKVNHAYLFSGPRGCGKTTSARILARCLNCAQGPTPTPCGECDSCRELATGGPGSLDVIEIDAASHGGVDDARDLRERATFAPTRDRYKIFIVDEAHMVSSAGFNALLKIVEEPPEHVKFIFATTEPDKVIGTIRSRTHHYPFRLVPPEPMMAHLEHLVASEQVSVAPGVLSLVVRAGGGSVRDTLSVLDQLIAGGTEGEVSYELAVNLLGFTPESLLDDVVDSLAALDSETAFRVVDRVIQSGQDPRRFVEDLLERLRDVLIVKAMNENASAVLHGVPEDQLRRLAAQAAQLSPAQISRAADITAKALTEMVGATSPKLHLELLVGRLMLPTADETEQGLAARIERIERRLEYGGGVGAGGAGGAAAAPAGSEPASASAPGPAASGADAARAALRKNQAPAAPSAPEPEAAVPAAAAEPTHSAPVPPEQSQQPSPQAAPEQQQPEPAQQAPVQQAPAAPAPQQSAPQDSTPQRSAPEQQAAQQPVPSTGTTNVEMARRAWPEIIEALKGRSRLIWMTVKDNASVVSFDGQTMTIGFSNDGARSTASGRGGEQMVAEAFQQLLGIQPRIDFIVGGEDPRASAAQPQQTQRAEHQQPAPQQQAAPHQQTPPQNFQQPQQWEQPNPKAEPEGRTQQQQPVPAAPAPTEPAPRVQHPAPTRQFEPVQQPQPVQQPAPVHQPESAQTEPAPAAAEAPAPEQPEQAEQPEQPEQPSTSAVSDFQPSAEDLADQEADFWGGDEPPLDDEEEQFGAYPAADAVQSQPAPASSAPAPDQSSGWAAPASASAEQRIAPQDPVAADGFAGFIPTPPPGESPAVPVFAKPEAELRAEFASKFGDIIPDFAKKSDQQSYPSTNQPASQRPDASAHTQPAAAAENSTGHEATSAPEESDAAEEADRSGTGTVDLDGFEPRPGSRFRQMIDQAEGRASSISEQPAPSPRQAGEAKAAELYRQQQQRAQAAATAEPGAQAVEEYFSEDDERIEDSGLVGRPVVERVLNARLIEELNPDGTPKI